MAKSEGENPDFGDLEPLGDELKPLGDELEPLGDELKPLGEEAGESSLDGLDAEEFIPPDFESLLTSESAAPEAAEPSALQAAAPAVEVAAEGAPAETEMAEEPAEEKPEEEAPAKVAKPASKLMAYLDWVIAGGIAALLLLLALAGLLNLSTAIYAVSVAIVAYAIWKGRQTNDLYTVMLGCCADRRLDGHLLPMAGGGPLSVRRQGEGSQAARERAVVAGNPLSRIGRILASTGFASQALRTARQRRDPSAEVVSTGSRALQQRGQIEGGLNATAAKQDLR